MDKEIATLIAYVQGLHIGDIIQLKEKLDQHFIRLIVDKKQKIIEIIEINNNQLKLADNFLKRIDRQSRA